LKDEDVSVMFFGVFVVFAEPLVLVVLVPSQIKFVCDERVLLDQQATLIGILDVEQKVSDVAIGKSHVAS
tara:strand:- start:2146 stop:2355 length:210 start_codon:yes stop_codon:yes gene_type:complete